MHSRRSISSIFVKPIQNLPFGFNVEHNTRVNQISSKHTSLCDIRRRKKQLLSKTIACRFNDSRYLFFTACLVYPVDFPLLGSIRVYFVQGSTKTPFALQWLSTPSQVKLNILLCPPEKFTHFHYPLDPQKIRAEDSMQRDTTP